MKKIIQISVVCVNAILTVITVLSVMVVLGDYSEEVPYGLLGFVCFKVAAATCVYICWVVFKKVNPETVERIMNEK